MNKLKNKLSRAEIWNKVLKKTFYTKAHILDAEEKLKRIFEEFTTYEINLYANKMEISSRGFENLYSFFGDIDDFLDDGPIDHSWSNDNTFETCLKYNSAPGHKTTFLDTVFEEIIEKEREDNDPFPRLTARELGIW